MLGLLKLCLQETSILEAREPAEVRIPATWPPRREGTGRRGEEPGQRPGGKKEPEMSPDSKEPQVVGQAGKKEQREVKGPTGL